MRCTSSAWIVAASMRAFCSSQYWTVRSSPIRFSSSAGSSVGATHWPMPGSAEPAFLTRLCRKSKPGTSLPKPLSSLIVSPRGLESIVDRAAARSRPASATETDLLDRRSRAGASAPAARSGRSCAGCRRRRTPSARRRAPCRSPRRGAGCGRRARRFIDSALGGAVEAIAPALVAFEVGEVAVDPRARQVREQRPRAAGIELVQAAGDELDRRFARRHAQRRDLRFGRLERGRRLAEVAGDERRGRDRSRTTDRAPRGAPPAPPAMRSGTPARTSRMAAASTHSAAMRRSSRATRAAGSRSSGAQSAALIRRLRTSASSTSSSSASTSLASNAAVVRGPGNIHAGCAACSVP